MNRTLVGILATVVLLVGCSARTYQLNRPVEVLVSSSAEEMYVVCLPGRLLLYVPEAMMDGKQIKNNLNENDLRECGVEIPEAYSTSLH